MRKLDFEMGGGGGGSTPDSIFGTDNVEVIIGVCQGPIKGLVDGPKSFQLGDTSLVEQDGTQNFKNISLEAYPGLESGHTITPSLGGFASPLVVGQLLATDTPVTRTGEQSFIDAVDFRINVSALYVSDDDGTHKNNLKLKFEWKRLSDSGWKPCWTQPSGSGFFSNGTVTTVIAAPDPNLPAGVSFDGDRELFVTASGPPSGPPENPLNPATAVDLGAHVYQWNTLTQAWVGPATMHTTTTPPDEVAGLHQFVDITGTPTRTLYNGGSAPRNSKIGDLWLTNGRLLVWNASAWVTGNSALLPSIPRYAQANGVWSMTEKVTSNVSRNIRFFLPPLEEKIQLRVTKLTAANTTSNPFQVADVTWESFSEIKRTPLTFYRTAITHLTGQASDQFTSLPVFNGIYDGRLVKIPSNYNPVTRVYTGIWDGTYVIAYTNNPAFIFQDFVENDEYGLSSIYPHTVNKWKIYEWGQHCDVIVHRLDGTPRPRWTYNDYIDQPRDARECAQFIAGAAAAVYVDDGNGVVDILIDKDYDPIALFTAQNVGEDGFDYSYTDAQSRANFLTVSFINPDLNWVEDKRLVQNDTNIAAVGRLPAPFIAAGCTDVDEALSRARRRLITNLTEKEFVTFNTNRKGRYLSEWETILVADPDMGTGISGRISEVIDSTSVRVRDQITFEAGFTYVATFDVVNPDYSDSDTAPFSIVRRTITNAAGPATVITFSEDLPELAEYAVFGIEADGLLGFPKPYKITKIDRQTGDPDRIVITALEVNRNKQAYIDGSADLGTTSYNIISSTTVAPPTNPKIEPELRTIGITSARILRVSWTASVTPFIKNYTVSYYNDGVFVNSADTTDLFMEFNGAHSGVHTFSIIARNIHGAVSLPSVVSHDVTGAVRVLDGPLNLRMLDQPSPTESATISPTFVWDVPAVVDPNFKYWLVEILDPITLAVRRTENVGSSTTWTYDFTKQIEDAVDVPARIFTILVCAVDQFGATSDTSELTIDNPTPLIPGPAIITPYANGFNVAAPVTDERDVVGLYYWVSSTPGFNPFAVPPSYDGVRNHILFIPLPPLTKRWVRYAFYDPYSKDPSTLNISDEQLVGAPVSEPLPNIVLTTGWRQAQPDPANAPYGGRYNLMPVTAGVPGLYGKPPFSYDVSTPGGRLLWNLYGLADDQAIAFVEQAADQTAYLDTDGSIRTRSAIGIYPQGPVYTVGETWIEPGPYGPKASGIHAPFNWSITGMWLYYPYKLPGDYVAGQGFTVDFTAQIVDTSNSTPWHDEGCYVTGLVVWPGFYNPGDEFIFHHDAPLSDAAPLTLVSGATLSPQQRNPGILSRNHFDLSDGAPHTITCKWSGRGEQGYDVDLSPCPNARRPLPSILVGTGLLDPTPLGPTGTIPGPGDTVFICLQMSKTIVLEGLDSTTPDDLSSHISNFAVNGGGIEIDPGVQASLKYNDGSYVDQYQPAEAGATKNPYNYDQATDPTLNSPNTVTELSIWVNGPVSKIRHNGVWVQFGGTPNFVQNAAPTSGMGVGSEWYSPALGNTYIWDGTAWLDLAAPPPPQNLVVEDGGTGIEILSWDASLNPTYDHTVIYRSSTPYFSDAIAISDPIP